MGLRAPFPWFGGKSRAAALIWARFGDVANYVEPFYGTGAVLLARPTEPRIETVNDADAMIANFWRAVQRAPEAVAHWADGPVNEADLHARHRWLVAELPAHRERMLQRPEYFNAKIAGWWCWGLSQWIGSGWCDGRLEQKRPAVGGGAPAAARGEGGFTKGRGVHADLSTKRPHLGGTGNGSGAGVHRRSLKAPNLSAAFGNGTGVHRTALWQQRPHVNGESGGMGVHVQIPRCNGLGGQGLHGARVPIQIPDVTGWGGKALPVEGFARRTGIAEWFTALQLRLRRVRVCCGDWTRIMGPSVILGNGVTGIVLDAPYREDERTRALYAEDVEKGGRCLSTEAREWALVHGDSPRLRIALCGYEGEHKMPASWACVEWKAPSGYGGGKQRHRERIWFSPHCLRAEQGQLALGVA